MIVIVSSNAYWGLPHEKVRLLADVRYKQAGVVEANKGFPGS